MSKESYYMFQRWEDLIGERMETWRRGHSQMYIFIYPGMREEAWSIVFFPTDLKGHILNIANACQLQA